jgi:hypothetical protein
MAAINHPLGHARRLPFPARVGRLNWWVLGAIAVFGVGAMLPVLQNSTATTRGFEVQQIQAKETTLNAEIEAMESDVARMTSMDRIEERAKEIGLVPGDSPIYVHVDVPGPEPAKIPAQYLPGPVPQTVVPDPWWRSLLSWVSLGN